MAQSNEYQKGYAAGRKWAMVFTTAQQPEFIDMNDSPAINVKQECADAYYANYDKLPERVKKKLSLDILSQIFMGMVVPAIDKARELDREESNT